LIEKEQLEEEQVQSQAVQQVEFVWKPVVVQVRLEEALALRSQR
jgi:hypothetical protein